MRFNPRILLAYVLALAVSLAFVTPTLAGTDPLSSWSDGPAKQAIIDFVQKTTDTLHRRLLMRLVRSGQRMYSQRLV